MYRLNLDHKDTADSAFHPALKGAGFFYFRNGLMREVLVYYEGLENRNISFIFS